MVFLNATISIAQFTRSLTITSFEDDTRDDLYNRYISQLGESKNRAILRRLIEFMEDNCYNGDTFFKVEVSPFGITRYSYNSGVIDSVEDVCDRLASLSMLVLFKRKNDERTCEEIQ